MEWIHCNACYKQPRSRDSDFVMTNCGHIFCKACESREDIDHCLVCKAKCRVTPLTSNMKPELRIYYEDVEQKLSTLANVIKFQKTHRISLFKKHIRVVDMYTHLKVENDLLRKKLVAAQKKLQIYERKQPLGLFQRTPGSNCVAPRNQYSGASTMNDPRTPAEEVYESTHAAFQFIQPHLRSHQRYRSNSQQTPYEPSSIGSTGTSTAFANRLHDRVNSASFIKQRGTPNLQRASQKGPTPLYNAMNGMQIHDRRIRK